MMSTEAVKNKRRRKRLKRRLLALALEGVVYLCVGWCGSRVIVHGVNFISGRVHAATARRPILAEADAVRASEETLALFHCMVWDRELTPEEKKTAIRKMVEPEASNLGVANPPHVEFVTLTGPENGHYDPGDNIIRIDVDHLETADSLEVLRTLAHEMRHCAQFETVRVYLSTDEAYRGLPMFRDAEQFLAEMQDYHTSADGELLYWNQKMEEDAREYARQRVIRYYPMIYLNAEGGDEVGKIDRLYAE